jgi:hypothetical protein
MARMHGAAPTALEGQLDVARLQALGPHIAPATGDGRRRYRRAANGPRVVVDSGR